MREPLLQRMDKAEIDDFHRGMDDADAFRLPRHSMSRAYYEGYYFAGSIEGLFG